MQLLQHWQCFADTQCTHMPAAQSLPHTQQLLLLLLLPPPHCLCRYLLELHAEAEYYGLMGLVRLIDRSAALPPQPLAHGLQAMGQQQSHQAVTIP